MVNDSDGDNDVDKKMVIMISIIMLVKITLLKDNHCTDNTLAIIQIMITGTIIM